MNKLESDLFIFGMMCDFIKSTGNKIEKIVPNYDKEKTFQLLMKQKMVESDEATDKAMVVLVNQIYKRIEKKFTT